MSTSLFNLHFLLSEALTSLPLAQQIANKVAIHPHHAQFAKVWRKLTQKEAAIGVHGPGNSLTFNISSAFV